MNGFDSPQGVSPDAPAGGGGPGRFTSRKQLGTMSVLSLHSQSGPRDAKDSPWVSRMNQSFAESANVDILDDIWDKGKRAKNVVTAYTLARDKYVGSMIFEETGRGLQELLHGLIPGLLMMLVAVAATTALGAGIGGLIGFCFGGVGAVPGAAVGAEIGFDFGLWLLNWLGIGFLIIYVGKHLAEVLNLLSSGVERAWSAGKGQKSEREDIEQSAKEIARAVGVLVRLILEGIVMYLLEKGTAAVVKQVGELAGKLKESKLGKGFAEWIEKNYQALIDDPRINRKLRETEKSSRSAAGSEVAKTPPEPKKAPPKEPEKAPRKEAKKEKPVRTAAQERAAISKLSNEAEALRKQGRFAEADAKIAEARELLKPYVKEKNWDAVVERLDVRSPRDKAVFWSGDKEGAKAVADELGGVTLEKTPGGRVLDNWNSEPELAYENGGKEMWGKVSEKYASGASGKVTVVQTPEKAAQGGGEVWKNHERDILYEGMAEGKVTGIEYKIIPKH
jgi:uncharacterized protein DUF6861